MYSVFNEIRWKSFTCI